METSSSVLASTRQEKSTITYNDEEQPSSCEAQCFGFRFSLNRRDCQEDAFLMLDVCNEKSRAYQISHLINDLCSHYALNRLSYMKLKRLLNSRYIHTDLLSPISPKQLMRTELVLGGKKKDIYLGGSILPIYLLLSHIQIHRSGINLYEINKWQDDLICQMACLAPQVVRFKYGKNMAAAPSITSFLLHECIKANTTIDTIKTIHEIYPDAINHIEEESGNSCLHLAILNLHHATTPGGVTLREQHCIHTINYISSQSPLLIQVPNKSKQLPMHTILASQFIPRGGNELIWQMYKSYPEAAIARDHEGNTPAHLAITTMKFSSFHGTCQKDTNNIKSKICIQMLNDYPDLVKVYNCDGHLLIHLAAQAREISNHSLLLEIIKKYPEGLQFPTTTDCLTPLHLACRNCFTNYNSGKLGLGAKAKALNILARCPQMMMKRDVHGYIPFLQDSCNSMTVSNDLYRLFFTRTNLVHHVCSQVDEVTGNNFVHFIAETAHIVSRNHRMGVFSLASCARILLDDILKVAPYSVQHENNDGDLPLHLLLKCRHHTQDSISFVRHFPESACYPNSTDSFYPFMMAAIHGDVAATFELLKVFLSFQSLSYGFEKTQEIIK